MFERYELGLIAKHTGQETETIYSIVIGVRRPVFDQMVEYKQETLKRVPRKNSPVLTVLNDTRKPVGYIIPGDLHKRKMQTFLRSIPMPFKIEINLQVTPLAYIGDLIVHPLWITLQAYVHQPKV